MMLSARMAECALRNRLIAHGRKVQDISLRQLTDSATLEWTTHDLLVDGVPWDVKNARQSRHDHQAYTSWCVPQFKTTRTADPVTIAGVLSPYLSEDDFGSGGHIAQWLGTVSRGRLRELELGFTAPDLVESLNLLGDGPSFLPPWLFEHPVSSYAKRSLALATLGHITPPPRDDCAVLGYSYEAALTARGQAAQIAPTSGPDETIDKLCEGMAENVASFGLSLSVVYLTLLVNFLRIVRDGDARKHWDVEVIQRVLYPTPDREWPLFVFDPLRCIQNAIESFARLATAPGIDTFRLFAMPNPSIVVGRRSANDPFPTTLLAYCGGWIGEERPCMMTPLRYGAHETCECGRLVCPECGFCMKTCLRYHARSQNAGNARLEGDDDDLRF
jgi:hypothetical protein